MSTGRPDDRKFAMDLFNAKRAALAPQQIKDPLTGSVYVGNPYTGYWRTAIPGMPEIYKSPLKVGGIERNEVYTLGRGPGGGLVRRPVPVEGAQPPAAAGAPAAPGAAPGMPGSPPLPSTVEGMADWAAEYEAKKKALSASAEKLAEARAGPVATAIKNGDEAHAVINALNTMKDAYAVGEGVISGGPAGEIILSLKNLANQFGVPVKGLTESQIINKIGTQLAFRATRKLSARPALLEVQMQVKANPGLGLNNEASKYMIDLMLQEATAEQALGRLASSVKDPAEWAGMKEKFYKENPLRSPFTGEPLSAGESVKQLFKAAGRPAPRNAAKTSPERLTAEAAAKLPLVETPQELKKLMEEGKIAHKQMFRVRAPDGSIKVKRAP